jgi:hypothetical protein
VIADIVVKSHPADYEWLPHLWYSIEKNVTGFRRVLLLIERQHYLPPVPSFVVVQRCENWGGTPVGGYRGQCIEKLRAHLHTDADIICFVDSDCVFVRPVDFRTFTWPLIVTPWEQAGDAICWYESTKRVLGFDPPLETMRTFPFVYPSSFLAEVWQHIGGIAGIIGHLREGMERLSEFNVLGNYAVARRPDLFRILRTDREPCPEQVIYQAWSHGGDTREEVIAERKRWGLR